MFLMVLCLKVWGIVLLNHNVSFENPFQLGFHLHVDIKCISSHNILLHEVVFLALPKVND